MLPAGVFCGTETTGFEQKGAEEEGEETRRQTKKPQWVKQNLALGRFIPQFYKECGMGTQGVISWGYPLQISEPDFG